MTIRPRTLVLTATMLLLATFVTWLAYAIPRARDTAQRIQCSANLFGIVFAMHNYQEMHGAFPPAYVAGPDGVPWHSWRVLLLPYVDEMDVYQEYRFDEPWNGPHNRRLLERIPRVYACPSDTVATREFRTNYFVIVGEGTPFPGADAMSFYDVRTDRSETFLVVESATQKALWMEPTDLNLETMSWTLNDPERPSLSSLHYDAVSTTCVDGSSCTLFFAESDDNDPQALRARCLIKAVE